MSRVLAPTTVASWKEALPSPEPHILNCAGRGFPEVSGQMSGFPGQLSYSQALGLARRPQPTLCPQSPSLQQGVQQDQRCLNGSRGSKQLTPQALSELRTRLHFLYWFLLPTTSFEERAPLC